MVFLSSELPYKLPSVKLEPIQLFEQNSDTVEALVASGAKKIFSPQEWYDSKIIKGLKLLLSIQKSAQRSQNICYLYQDNNFYFSKSARQTEVFQKYSYQITEIGSSDKIATSSQIVQLSIELSLDYAWIHKTGHLEKLSISELQEVFDKVHFQEEDMSNIFEALQQFKTQSVDVEVLERAIIKYFFNYEDILKILNAMLKSAQNDAVYYVSNNENPASSILLHRLLQGIVLWDIPTICLQKTSSNGWQWVEKSDNANTFDFSHYIAKLHDKRKESRKLFSKIKEDSTFLVVGLDEVNVMKDIVIKIDGEKSAMECGLQDVIEIFRPNVMRNTAALFQTNYASPSSNTQRMNFNSGMQFYCIPGSDKVYVGYLPIF